MYYAYHTRKRISAILKKKFLEKELTMKLQDEAVKVLNKAYIYALQNPVSGCKHKDFLDYVFDNTHLTYKYILFTALLAKATDERLNPLCLQKQSQLKGAYDARSLCHKVVVPFEMNILNKAMGGSNEPFLNKPARFPELDKQNAVRRGNDQSILNALCNNLPKITTATEAYQCLVYVLGKLIRLRDQISKLTAFTLDKNINNKNTLLLYIFEALKESYEGEILTLMVAGVYHLLYLSNPNITVEVHPVNQSGKSGSEISDLDIYFGDTLFSSNELKDKDYTENDIRHAADKVLHAGGNNILFIEGSHSKSRSSLISAIEQEYSEQNFALKVINYKDFFPVVVSLIPAIDCQEFMLFILSTIHEKKFKQEVMT